MLRARPLALARRAARHFSQIRPERYQEAQSMHAKFVRDEEKLWATFQNLDKVRPYCLDGAYIPPDTKFREGDTVQEKRTKVRLQWAAYLNHRNRWLLELKEKRRVELGGKTYTQEERSHILKTRKDALDTLEAEAMQFFVASIAPPAFIGQQRALETADDKYLAEMMLDNEKIQEMEKLLQVTLDDSLRFADADTETDKIEKCKGQLAFFLKQADSKLEEAVKEFGEVREELAIMTPEEQKEYIATHLPTYDITKVEESDLLALLAKEPIEDFFAKAQQIPEGKKAESDGEDNVEEADFEVMRQQDEQDEAWEPAEDAEESEESDSDELVASVPAGMLQVQALEARLKKARLALFRQVEIMNESDPAWTQDRETVEKEVALLDDVLQAMQKHPTAIDTANLATYEHRIATLRSDLDTGILSPAFREKHKMPPSNRVLLEKLGLWKKGNPDNPKFAVAASDFEIAHQDAVRYNEEIDDAAAHGIQLHRRIDLADSSLDPSVLKRGLTCVRVAALRRYIKIKQNRQGRAEKFMWLDTNELDLSINDPKAPWKDEVMEEMRSLLHRTSRWTPVDKANYLLEIKEELKGENWTEEALAKTDY